MKICNKRKFVTAAVATLLSLTCFIAYFLSKQEPRFLIACFLALVYAGSSYYGAFSKKAAVEEWRPGADERDVFIAMETSRTTIQVLNVLLLAACVAGTVVYALLRSPVCLAVLITLCIVSVTLFVVILCVNIYYEKKR